VLSSLHRLDRLPLERDHLARGEGAPWEVGPLIDRDQLARREAVLTLRLHHRQRHRAHPSRQRITQERALLDDGGALEIAVRGERD
jgi:hypothetical protein